MHISDRGIELIKKFEGLKLESYLCPAGVWTIGYGSTGDHVKPNMTVSLVQAEKLLKDDLKRFENAVNSLVRVDITQSQFDALVSFAFNVGIGALQSSTLLRVLNRGLHAAAGDELLRWNKAGNKVLHGVTYSYTDADAYSVGFSSTPAIASDVR